MDMVWSKGYDAGFTGETRMSCGYDGRKRERWLSGFNAGQDSRRDGAGTPSTMQEWRAANPNPTHGCGHMQGRGAA